MLLSEHAYSVAVTFKMTERVEQWICIKFCIKLEHSSTKTVRMIQKASAIGNWWWAASSDNVSTHASYLMQSFLAKHQITQVTQPPYSPDLVPCDFWLVPKPKSLLKGKRFQTINEIRENIAGQLMVMGELCEVPRYLLWGDWGIIVLCTMLLVSCIFFNNCPYFLYYMARYLLDNRYICYIDR